MFYGTVKRDNDEECSFHTEVFVFLRTIKYYMSETTCYEMVELSAMIVIPSNETRGDTINQRLSLTQLEITIK